MQLHKSQRKLKEKLFWVEAGFLSTKGREAAKMKAISKMSIRESESLGRYNSNQLRDIVAG